MKNGEKRIEESLDNLTSYCGYFNGNTCVNNGYGCNHKDCEEGEIVRKSKSPHMFDSEDYMPDHVERKIWMAFLRKKIGSVRSIKLQSKTVIKGLRIEFERNICNNDFLKQFGCVYQGKCYSFSCPIATEKDGYEEIMLLDEDYEYDETNDINRR